VGSDGQWSPGLLTELRELYEPLRRYAAVVGSWDVEPDDLVQEAFVRLLRTPAGHVQDTKAYLRRTIANLATDERRRSRRAVAAMQRLEPVGAAVDEYPSSLSDLMQLDGRTRGLLYLVEVEGLPIRDAAAAVGTTATAARMTLTRARRRLRGAMDEESKS
jgi:RNA polymerase sigma-70 factor (ECF subfamily)